MARVKTMIRLIVTDLDDTLLDARGRLPAQNIEALQEARNRGAVVTIATGRMTSAAVGFARQLGVDSPMIVFNGGLVYDPVHENVIYENPVPLDLTREILRMAEEMGVYIQYFDRDHYYFERRCSYANAYGAHVGFAGIETKQKLSEWVAQPASKLLIDTRPEIRDEVCAKFREAFGDRLNIMPTRMSYIEFVANGVDKGFALEKLAESMGLGPDEVAAFGDAQNDIGMLKWAGHGWWMQNGHPTVRSAAKYIAPANTEFGVARAIDEMIQNGLL